MKTIETFKEYEKLARRTATYPRKGNNIDYPTLGLAGEAGEVANKVSKIQRDDHEKLTMTRREQIIEELGDTLWFLQQVCYELVVPLQHVAERNIAKLSTRLENGTVHGEGDER